MFTVDTTVLTLEGWKGYSQLSNNDKVATFNRFNGEIEYQAPIEIVCKEDYEGELILIQNRDTNQLLTPDHRILLKEPYQRNKRKHWDFHWSFKIAKDIFKIAKTKSKVKFPLAGKYKAGTLSIGNYYAELLGWILTDGDFPKERRSIGISQSSVHPVKVNRIRYLLDNLNVKYTENIREQYNNIYNPMHRFYLNASPFTDRIRLDIPNKKPTWDLLQLRPSELISLFKGLMAGDSSLYSRSNRKKDDTLENRARFAQRSSYTRNWIQALCCLVGCRSKDNPNSESTPSIALNGRDTTQIRKPHIIIKRTKEPLMVWGIKMKNQSIVCHRVGHEIIKKGKNKGQRVKKGYVFITGDLN